MATSQINWSMHLLLCCSLSFAACSGGSSAADSDSSIVSGLVRAPGGSTAFLKHHGLGNYFTNEAFAALTGIGNVPDNTLVELVRLGANFQTTSVVSTTTTSNGRYSFNLLDLGITWSTDLIVRVIASDGKPMRAFVTPPTTDLDPVSEATYQVVIEALAGRSLNNLTLEELSDIAAAMSLLARFEVGGNASTIDQAVELVRASIRSNSQLSAFITAAASSGQTSQGPGDIGDYFPMAKGNVWRYQISKNTPGQQTIGYFNTITSDGTKVISVSSGPSTVTAFKSNNSEGDAIVEESYYVKDSQGLTTYGNSDLSDRLTPQLVPYALLHFPFRPGTTFTQVQKLADLGQDLDGDQRSETVQVSAQVSVRGFENTTVSVGSFAHTVKLETTNTAVATLSASGARVVLTATETTWLAPRIGLVKRNTVIQDGGLITNVNEELDSYSVNGQGTGITNLTIASGVAPADSDTSIPTQAGVASDGTRYLVVSCRVLGASPGLFGVFVSGGIVDGTIPIGSRTCTNVGLPDVAFDGTNFLVVFGKEGSIRGIRISQSGAVLDAGDGFSVSTGAPLNTSYGPVAAYDGTNYLVTWSKFVGGSHDIYAAVLTPEGQVLKEFPIFPDPSLQTSPAVAFDGTNYLVVWHDRRPVGATSQSSIYGARISPSGAIVDSTKLAIVTTAGFNSYPDLAFDGENYLVVWSNALTSGIDPAVSTIHGARLNKDGMLLDGPAESGGFMINAPLLGKSNPKVTFNGQDYLIAWVVGSFPNDPPAGMRGAKVSPNGLVVEGADTAGIPLSNSPGAYARFAFPSIASTGSSSLLVWGNIVELFGQTKSIEGAVVFR